MIRRPFISISCTFLSPHPSPLPKGERDGVRGNPARFTKYCYICFSLFLVGFFLTGCPKRIEVLPPEKPPFVNPIVKLFEAFSSVESFQAKTSIRIDTMRDGEEMNFLLNGFLIYQKPDKLRLLGYHPLGMGLFDALLRNGEFFLLIPPQKKAYTGEISQFEDVMEKAGPIEISTEKDEGNEIPNRIRIVMVEKETRIELKLKNISVNSTLPEDSFQWQVPEGVEVRPLTRLLKGKSLR
jgi:outer membrane lipoprotein-sorting protein